MKAAEDKTLVERWNKEKSSKARRIGKTLKFYSRIKNANPIILDVGCYEGSMEEYFVKLTENFVIGFDVSFKALKKAGETRKAKNLTNFEYIVAAADVIPLKNEQIDW